MVKSKKSKKPVVGSVNRGFSGPRRKKLVVGFYDLTGCNGCLLSFLFNEEELLDLVQHIDIKTFRFVKGVKDDKKFDVVFMEGLVACNNDLEVLKSVRQRTKILVAFGACASTGCIPAYRNFIDTSKYSGMVYERVKDLRDTPARPIAEHVSVDYHIHGCPPDKKQIVTFIKDMALGKTPQDYDSPVCFECRLNENKCLLDEGKMCLGPITRGGCNSICVNGGFECWGCRGPTPDANIPLMIKLLEEKGFKKDQIKQRLRTFAGLMIETPPKQKIVNPIKIKSQKENVKPKNRKENQKKLKIIKKIKKHKKKTIIKKKSKKKTNKHNKRNTHNKVNKVVKKKVKKKKTVKKNIKKKLVKKKVKKKVVKKKQIKKKAVKKNEKNIKKKKSVKKQIKKRIVRKPVKKVVKKKIAKKQKKVKKSLFSILKKK